MALRSAGALALLLALLGSPVMARADVETPPAANGGSVGFFPLPYATYGSDIGLKGGLILFVYGRDPERGERTSWASLEGAGSTRGPRFVQAKGEWLPLGRERPRLFGRLRAASDPEAPYWGEGADTDAAGVAPGSESPPPLYRFELTELLAIAGARAKVAGKLQGFGYLRWREASVAHPGPLLALSSPPGAAGGRVALGAVGLAFDTRDREGLPRRGVLAEATIFGAPSMGSASEFAFWGAAASLRGYATPWVGGTAQLRLLGELKRGDVPFFERNRFEGLQPDTGLGGSRTIRGVARDRISGEEKLLANLELRHLWPVRLFGADSAWGFAAGVDAGWARQRGYEPVSAVGGFGGLRYAWDRAATIRLDFGFAGQGGVGIYLDLEE